MLISYVLGRLRFSVTTFQLKFLTSAALWSLFVALLFPGPASVACLGEYMSVGMLPVYAWNAALDDELTCAAIAPRWVRDSELEPGLLEPDARWKPAFAEDSSSMSRLASAPVARRREGLRGASVGNVPSQIRRGCSELYRAQWRHESRSYMCVWCFQKTLCLRSAWRLDSRVK